MLQLTLRSEFRGRRLGGTAIELENTKNTGATQMAAADFLELTYPSADALQSLEAVGPDRGRPLVLIGERGQGKSHLMALLHHAFTDADATRAWLEAWSERLEDQKLAALPLRDGMHVISESLHRQRYKFLWDLLFERHPHGAEVRGMWKGLGDRQTEVPSSDHLLELFRRKPTALILDEYQTWFDGLTNTKQFPWRNWAFNVVQILSEIAKAQAVARAVNAGAVVALDTVDFSDPNRPKTCLEVDFPILPVNQIATIEGNAGKPIYQMSKWWARRRSSVFRSLLIAAATRAPADPAAAAKTVWDVYYANHQTKGAFSGLKVADMFMGGGTTIVEGSRLGMQMYGADLNPVAWFIVRNALSDVTRTEVEALLADVEAEVRPQIMPFYTCDCPRGHHGVWTRRSTGEEMGADFDPLALTPEQRTDYDYRGPETISVFWAKHGPCQVTGCGHRTPLMSSPVMAVKTLTVRAWLHRCAGCGGDFDIEERDARMAPGVAQIITADEAPYAVLAPDVSVRCPRCDRHESMPSLQSRLAKRKRITLFLLVSPQWLTGASNATEDGAVLGGSVTDTAAATARWNQVRATMNTLFEVRGALPKEVICPYTGARVRTDKGGGTVPKKSAFACGACGTVQDVLTAVKATGKTGPVAAYGVQGYCHACDAEKQPYRGRFFAPVTDTRHFDAAAAEWEQRQASDLSAWRPESVLPYGFMTHKLNGGIPNHGFTHWWTMFNARQLLGHTQLLRAMGMSRMLLN